MSFMSVANADIMFLCHSFTELSPDGGRLFRKINARVHTDDVLNFIQCESIATVLRSVACVRVICFGAVVLCGGPGFCVGPVKLAV